MAAVPTKLRKKRADQVLGSVMHWCHLRKLVRRNAGAPLVAIEPLQFVRRTRDADGRVVFR